MARTKKELMGTPRGRGKAQSASARRKSTASPPISEMPEFTKAQLAQAINQLLNPVLTDFSDTPDWSTAEGGDGGINLNDGGLPNPTHQYGAQIHELQLHVRALADKFKHLEWTVNQIYAALGPAMKTRGMEA